MCTAISLAGFVALICITCSYLGTAHTVLVAGIAVAVLGSEIVRSLLQSLEICLMLIRFSTPMLGRIAFCALQLLNQLVTYACSLPGYIRWAWTRTSPRLYGAAGSVLNALGFAVYETLILFCICVRMVLELACRIIGQALICLLRAVAQAQRFVSNAATIARACGSAQVWRDMVLVVSRVTTQGYRAACEPFIIVSRLEKEKLILSAEIHDLKLTVKELKKLADEKCKLESKIKSLEKVIETIESEFTCSVSRDIMEEPVIAIPCGHAFDKSSFDSLQDTRNPRLPFSCPLCRITIQMHFETNSIFIKNTITALKTDK